MVNIMLSVVLMKYMAHSGLALAHSLATGANTLFLYFGLKTHLPYLKGKTLIVSLGKICLASGVMALVTWGAAVFLEAKLDINMGRNLALLVLSAITLGVFTYFIAVILFKVDDVKVMLDTLLKKFKGKAGERK